MRREWGERGQEIKSIYEEELKLLKQIKRGEFCWVERLG